MKPFPVNQLNWVGFKSVFDFFKCGMKPTIHHVLPSYYLIRNTFCATSTEDNEVVCKLKIKLKKDWTPNIGPQ